MGRRRHPLGRRRHPLGRHLASRHRCRLDSIISRKHSEKRPTSSQGGRHGHAGIPISAPCQKACNSVIITEEIFLSNKAKTSATVQAESISEQMSGSGKGGRRVRWPVGRHVGRHVRRPVGRHVRRLVGRRVRWCVGRHSLYRAAPQKLRSLVNVGPSRGILVFSYPLGFHLVT